MNDAPIDLSEVRAAREVSGEPGMRKWYDGGWLYLYIAEYQRDGASWFVEFWAHDTDDARRAVAAMNEGLTFSGQVVGKRDA